MYGLDSKKVIDATLVRDPRAAMRHTLATAPLTVRHAAALIVRLLELVHGVQHH